MRWQAPEGRELTWIVFPPPTHPSQPETPGLPPADAQIGPPFSGLNGPSLESPLRSFESRLPESGERAIKAGFLVKANGAWTRMRRARYQRHTV